MEKEGIIMKDEERKEIKEELKKKIDEMTDEELDNIAGGGMLDELKKIADSLAKGLLPYETQSKDEKQQ